MSLPTPDETSFGTLAIRPSLVEPIAPSGRRVAQTREVRARRIGPASLRPGCDDTDLDQAVARALAQAPPLSAAQRERLGRILGRGT